MARRSPAALSFVEMVGALEAKLRPPLGAILGSPREAAELVAALQPLAGTASQVVCYQMDLDQAERLGEDLGERSVPARVLTLPDLWDLPDPLQSLIYAIPQGGER